MDSSAERLAIDGGTPVRERLLPYGRQHVTEDDIRAVVDTLRSDWLTTGPGIPAFEEAFAAAVGSQHAVAFANGTAALHGAVFAAGLGPGDAGITTPLTFCASANCMVYRGATPLFGDIDPDTLNLDPQSVRERLIDDVRVIIAVDFAGHPADYNALGAIAREFDLTLIADGAHALGAEYQGQRVGSVADLTTFSFHPVKHIATGEGGMVTTNDADQAARMRRFRNHGITSEARDRQSRGQWSYELFELGYNYRLSDIACALGQSQLARLDENVARRRAVRKRYDAALAHLPELRLVSEREHCRSAWHLYPVRIEPERLRADREQIFKALRAENIGVAVHYIPVPALAYYQSRFAIPTSDYPEAHRAYETLLSLPMFHSITDADVDDVITAVEKVIGHYRA